MEHDKPIPTDETPDDGWVDDLARRAGGALRRPAPIDGAAALHQRNEARRTRRAVTIAGTVGVLVIGALGVVSLRKDTPEVVSDGQTVTTTSPPGITTALSTTTARPTTTAPSTSSPPSTTLAPTTTRPPTTTTSAQLDVRTDPLAWALAYTDGTRGAANGAPVRFGWISPDQTDTIRRDALAATVEYVNEQLGGIQGRPIEIVRCDPELDGGELACAQQMAADATLAAVISTSWFPSKDALSQITRVPVVAPFLLFPATVGDAAFSFATDPTTMALVNLALAADQFPEADTVALVIGDVSAVDAQVLAASLPGKTLLTIRPDGSSPAEIAASIRRADSGGAVDVLVSVDAVGNSLCQNLPAAATLLNPRPALIAVDVCLVQYGGEEFVAGTAQRGEFDGVILTTPGNPFDPTLNGDHVLHAVLANDQPTVEALTTFQAVMALTKIINELPDATPIDGPTVKQAILDFRGSILLQHGVFACGQATTPLVTYDAPAVCSDQVTVFRFGNGEWVPLANGLNGKIAGFTGIVDVDPDLFVR